MNKEQKIEKLQQRIIETQRVLRSPRLGPEFSKWHRDTEITIEKIFGLDSRHLKDFRGISFLLGVIPIEEYKQQQYYEKGFARAVAILKSMQGELAEDWGEEDLSNSKDSLHDLRLLCSRFHLIARQLRDRHNNRETLSIDDEYDVQDLVHSLLVLFFEDIRAEEWAPSYAGGASRMDFLLKEIQTVIEIKKSRKGLDSKELGEQLIIDIAKYRHHPNCRKLVCFVYDPEGSIRNPRGIENDLNRVEDGFEVIVLIRP